MSRSSKLWQIVRDGHTWPIPIGHPDSDEAPVWVWGDEQLAERICRFLNQNEKKENNPLTDGHCQCRD